MKRRGLALSLAVAGLLLASSPAGAQPRTVELSRLIGSSMAEVRDALGRDAAGPWRAGLRIADAAGELELFTVATEPWVVLAENPREGQRVCRTEFGRASEDGIKPYPDRTAELALVFRDGRLADALSSPLKLVPREPGPMTTRMLRQMQRAPRDAPLAEAPGRLPLSDGASFLARRPELRLPLETVLAVQCRPFVRPNHNPGFDEAGFVQGLALLPLALGLPALNRERARARRDGGAFMDSLSLGQVLPGGPDAAARRLRGAYVLRDADPSYAVLVVDLGAEPSRNVGRMNHAGLVGLKGVRVVWIGRTDRRAPLGLSSALCLDRDSRPGKVRRGCSSTGYFTP